MKILLLLLCLFNILRFSAAVNYRNASRQIINNILTNYDRNQLPEGIEDVNGPIPVTVNMYIRQMSPPNLKTMRIYLQVTLRQQWIDNRLAFDDNEGFDFVNLGDEEQKKVWRPDTFIQNSVTIDRHDFEENNVLLRIYQDGAILYSVRLSMELSCPMSFRYFPADTNICTMDLASYKYTTVDIKYLWKNSRPIQLKSTLDQSILGFELRSVRTDLCTSKTNTGEYSCLRAKFELKREFSPYFTTYYMGGMLAVGISWLALFLNKRHVTARVIIALFSMFAISCQGYMMGKELPSHIGYIPLGMLWVYCCFLMALISLLMTVCVNCCTNDQPNYAPQGPPSPLAFTAMHNDDEEFMPVLKKPQRRSMNKARACNWCGRILFPVIFVILNVIYWIAFLA